MALKYAVLGLLTERRSYGYDLVHDLSDRLGPAWQLGASSVYAALDKLEAEGLIRTCSVSSEDDLSGSREAAVRRVTFEATTAGRKAFENWIAKADCRTEPIRSELYLKVAVARPQDVPALLRAVETASRLGRERQSECAEQFEPLRGDSWQRAAAIFARTGALATSRRSCAGWRGCALSSLRRRRSGPRWSRSSSWNRRSGAASGWIRCLCA